MEPVDSKHEEKQAALYAALSKAQGEMEAASKDRKNSHMGYKYATLESVISALREPFAKNGLCHWANPSFDFTQSPPMVAVDVFVAHSGGGMMCSRLETRMGDEKGLTPIQVSGKQITYLRRYGLMCLAGISSADDDNDGSTAKPDNDVEEQPKLTREDEGKKFMDYIFGLLGAASSLTDVHKVRVVANGDKRRLALTEDQASALRTHFSAAEARLKTPVDAAAAAEDVPSLGK